MTRPRPTSTQRGMVHGCLLGVVLWLALLAVVFAGVWLATAAR